MRAQSWVNSKRPVRAWALCFTQSGNTEAFLAPADQIWVCCSPIFIFFCASFLQLQPQSWMSSWVASSSLTTHWPLCFGGGGVSLRKSNVTTARNHCQFKETQKKRINTWRMHKPTWLFQKYLIRLSEKESDTTYLKRLWSHRDLTPRILRELKLLWTCCHTAGGFWGQRSGTGLIYFSCIYL